ncbi:MULTISPECIES: Appr-1-p processing domain-containing protein [Thermomonospora]|uniref:Appr-1-p processing domain protein n=1 Tax=Thermomonospora curvata (strain ATCC 19995 / DSM 43183 / JCM 3096 / KCTC 9072 / NBRC 15933 / NCIMB 10081 / Henssen B9) TaxID=471852 RepID=D1AA38_THECD|nr:MULTISPECIES: Appr-1-p processing domain-containing protein [Thermomonospora]ACY96974.1 Appr-1-p processing domain protein [Thermomonospora curvata DSM 43183]PKK15250.1 MAG: hypothetical protein BUE48_006800 [Thermomonospora sp. CIF 1]
MEPPAYELLTADLKKLRERGLARLRQTSLPALETAAALCGDGDPASGSMYRTATLEDILRKAVADLGGDLSEAAGYTFGLVSGTRDWPVGERRKRAAAIYGVSTERFRKHHEQLIVEQVAESILKLCKTNESARSAPPSAPALPDGPRELRLGGPELPVTLHFMPVEMVRGVDVIVSSENVYLEISKLFRSSLSAALRRAAARISETGEILDDVIQRELTQWMRKHGRFGLPVAAGTVAPTTPGEMARAGVRRLYHAAVAVPRMGGDAYDITPEAVARAVRNVFHLAEQERERFDPPLRSIAFPLFGAGRGGLDPAVSFGYLWAALEREIGGRSGHWDLHLITRSRRDAEAVVRLLDRNG